MAIAIDTTQVEWKTASPLWSTFLQNEEVQRLNKPVLLRFKKDTFMEDLTNLLQTETDPQQLATQFADLIAKPESFRAPPTGESPDWQPTLTAADPLKLYQPVHGFFYLVASSLVCHVPGLPDRVVNTSKKEKVSFVLRRLANDGTEMAWVSDPDPTKDPAKSKSWQPLNGNSTTLAQFEELLPVFPLNFTRNGQKRRLLIGLIPTSSREAFQAAPSVSPIPTDQDPELVLERLKKNPLLDEAETQVTEPLKKLLSYDPPAPAGQPLPDPANLEARRQQQIQASRFILLDFAIFLSKNLPTLWLAMLDPTLPVPIDNTSMLYTLLKTTVVEMPGAITWQVALQQAWASRSLFADGGVPNNPLIPSYNLKNTPMVPDTLHTALETALGPYVPPVSLPLTPPAEVPSVPKLDSRPETRYLLRCVYQRPNCGPLHPDVISEATDQFAFASYFDFDAPTRPIRIGMPIDTSVAGLRKFRKNVAFLISNKLRQQMESVSNMKNALDGQIDNSVPSFDLGVICSFSIPIITICALVLLLCMVIVLNIVFWWLPFFRICFPLKLKG